MLPHIQRQLTTSDFNINELQVFLAQGKTLFQRKKKIEGAILANPKMRKTPAYYSMTREEKMNFVFKQTEVIHREVLPSLGIKDITAIDVATIQSSLMGTWPFTTHIGMFGVQIEALGTKEQADYWLPKANTFEVIGCYAQTELGHGSDVQNLETTATYDLESGQFVIHTPTLSASKFWPGDLGKLANHAVVLARLIVKGKDYGIQTFVVRIREDGSHIPLKGVEVGDIGPKHGYQNKQNGYAVFTNFRVPGSSLLARYISVSKTGEVTTQGDPKIAYFTMMFNRIYIIQECHGYLAKSLAISLRYSAYRRQFKTTSDGSERIILDYQNQQYRLIPILATAFAFFFAYRKTKDLFYETETKVKQGDMSGLGTLHRIISALKAFMTWDTLNGCEECRQCCGGHGYLEYAGISQDVLDFAARCTYEGDNGVLTQQIGRGLLKQLQKALQGKQIDQNASYLLELDTLLSVKSKVVNHEWSVSAIHEALKVRAAFAVSSVGRNLQYLMSQDKSQSAIFSEEIQSDLTNMSKIHTDLIIFDNFKSGLEEAAKKTELTGKTVTYLESLLKIYGLKCLRDQMLGLFVTGYLSPSQGQGIELALKNEIKGVRKAVIGLIEAMAPPDEFLFSAIGNKTKDPYENLMDWAKKYNPMNKEEVLPGVKEFLLSLRRPKL